MIEHSTDPAIAVIDLKPLECRIVLLRLWRRAYQAEADLVRIDDFAPLRVSLDALAARPGTFYGLTRGQHLAGAIEVEQRGSRSLEISALVVDPDCFRRGVGRRLLQFILRSSPDNVLVSTCSANTPALMLYRSMGFRQTKTFASPEGIELCALEWRARWAPETAP